MNLFSKYKDKSVTSRLSLTGVFFALVLLFQYLSSFMHYGGTLINFNFSLLFILPIFYFAGPSFGFITIILRFIFGVTIDGEWGFLVGVIGHVILMISTLIVIGYMSIFSILFKNNKNHNKKIIYISICTILSASVTLTLLNGVWFTPMYISAIKNNLLTMFDISEAIKLYKNGLYVFHFGIPNYWGGIFAVYLSGNIIKFGMVYIINYPLSKVIRHFY